MALITISDLETYLGTTITDDPSNDSDTYSLYSFLISAIDSKIKSICNRDLEATDYEEYYDGTGSTDMNLKQYPINTVTSVVGTDPWGNETALTSTYFSINDDGSLYYFYGFVKGRRNYKITYNAGYVTIPDDLKQIALQMVVSAYNSSAKDINIKEERIGDYSYKLAGYVEITKEQTSALQKYINYAT